MLHFSLTSWKVQKMVRQKKCNAVILMEAFDAVNHVLRLAKLYAYAPSWQALSILHNYFAME